MDKNGIFITPRGKPRGIRFILRSRIPGYIRLRPPKTDFSEIILYAFIPAASHGVFS